MQRSNKWVNCSHERIRGHPLIFEFWNNKNILLFDNKGAGAALFREGMEKTFQNEKEGQSLNCELKLKSYKYYSLFKL